MTAAASENKRIIRDAYDAMAGGDVRGFLGVLDEQIEVREPDGLPHGGLYRGLGELKEMFVKAAPVLDVGGMVVDDLVAEEDRVVAVLRIPLRSGGGEALISEHWRLRDGKAVSLRVFWFDPSLVSVEA